MVLLLKPKSKIVFQAFSEIMSCNFIIYLFVTFSIGFNSHWMENIEEKREIQSISSDIL